MLIKDLPFPWKRLVLANLIWLSLSSVTNQGIVAVSLLITARSLGPFSFGRLSACLALARLTSIFFNMGMDTWMLRAGRVGEIPVGSVITNVLIIKSALGALWLPGILLLSQFLNPNAYPLLLLLLSALSIWIESIINTISQGFNLLLRNDLTLKLTAASSTLLLLITLVLSALHSINPLCFALARLFTGWLMAGIEVLLIIRMLTLRQDCKHLPSVFIHSLPFALSDALLLIYTQADITLVAILLDSKSVGLYSTASSVLRATFVVPSAVFWVMTPLISQLGKQRDLSRFAKISIQTCLSMLAIGLALWLSMRIGGPLFVRVVLPEGFTLAEKVLSVLSVILLFKSCSYALAIVIIATEKQMWRVAVQGIAALVNFGLNLVFTPIYGIIGAAWIYVASEGLLLIGYMFVALKGMWFFRNRVKQYELYANSGRKTD